MRWGNAIIGEACCKRKRHAHGIPAGSPDQDWTLLDRTLIGITVDSLPEYARSPAKPSGCYEEVYNQPTISLTP